MDRREFVQKSALAGAGALLLTGAACQDAHTDEALAGKKVLMVYGGWEGHNPEACRDLFVPWLRSLGAEVEVSDNLDIYTDAEVMHSLDLVVQTWTMGKINAEQLKGLLDAVRSGTGIAGWHGGIGDSFRDNPEYEFMIGGHFVAHPGGFVPYSVRIIDQEDPVMDGIEDFDIHTEQYYMHVDPNNKVLATTQFNGDHLKWIDGCTMPVVWKKMYGAGRVFFTAIGHNMDDHAVPSARKILERGIIWASQSKGSNPEDLQRPVYKVS